MSSNLSSMSSLNHLTELNPNALEFIPEKKNNFKPNDQIKKVPCCSLDVQFDEPNFDNLEKSFVKNNEWLFYL